MCAAQASKCGLDKVHKGQRINVHNDLFIFSFYLEKLKHSLIHKGFFLGCLISFLVIETNTRLNILEVKLVSLENGAFLMYIYVVFM